MNINDFIGLPYREGARGPDAYDCYGLVMAVFRAACGVSLPDWYQDGPGTRAASRAISEALAGEISGGRSSKVSEPANLDIAIVGHASRAHHIGVVWDSGVLHAARAFGSVWHQLPQFITYYPETEFYRWHP